MGAATAHIKETWIPKGMQIPLAFSVVLHVVLVVGSIVGLPYVKQPPPVIADPISVEIVEIDKETKTNKPPIKAPPKKQEKKPEVAKSEKPPAPPKMTAKEVPKDIPAETPKPVKKAEAKPQPKVPPPQAELKEAPKPKKPPKKEEETPAPDTEAFNSLLRNLQDSEEQVVEEVEEKKVASAQMSPLARFSQRMSMSEADALRRQLSQCWSIQAGAKYAENLVVEIKLMMNPDRTVRQAVLVDRARYNRDGFFRAAADSAMRAVRSPLCSPLNLPPDKFDLWREINVKFDPREML